MSSLQLSVIIVSYNVKYFLRQCLQSVERALEGLAGEVWVVDNASVDGSVEMVKQEFPRVRLIVNDTNLGFAKANNQAIRQARGEYVLLLNPDTIVQEDTFHKVLAFFKEHPEAGAVGVKIIDGNGQFAHDSRRNFPSGWNIFTKITGLYRLWPKSKLFGGYHLTYLPEDQITPVPVLLGAFLCVPKKVLDEVGLLDERFFMYAEDIDLCYRIVQAGYTNYYLPTTQIIHFKGESTKLHSLSYVLAFYKASLQFIQKHYMGWKRWPAALLYQMAIVVAATLSAGKRLFQRVALPLTEWAALWGLSYGLTTAWAAHTGKTFPNLYYQVILPLYALWLVVAHLIFLNYAPPYRIRKVVGAAITGFLLIALTGYFMPPINYSRFIAAALSFGAVPLGLMLRALHNWLRQGRLHLTGEISQRVLIVAAPQHFQRLYKLLFQDIRYPAEFLGFVSPTTHPQALGTLAQLPSIIEHTSAEELVFCNASLSSQEIITLMTRYFYKRLSFKIVPPYADYLIGPQSILVSRYSLRLYLRLHQPEVLFQKKLFDMVAATLLLLSYPLTFWIYHKPLAALKSLFGVLAGRYHFVSYSEIPTEEMPLLKEGLLTTDFLRAQYPRTLNADLLYAHRYSILLDWKILMLGLPHLGTAR